MLHAYKDYLSRLPISNHTRRNYLTRVKRFLEWLDGTPDGERALTEAVDRDLSVKDFQNFLLRQGRSANTVNSTLAAIDNFYLSIGMGASKVKRQELPEQAPRALDGHEANRFFREVLRCKSLRNQTIAMLMMHCGLRISEVKDLNVSDLILTARIHKVIVRCGKNGKRREVPMNSETAAIVQKYLSELKAVDAESPLFKSQKGNRLSLQAIDRVIRGFGQAAGVEISSHCLRHTCLTKLLRSGADIVMVSQLAGHSRLETTRRYTLPTEAIMVSAVERIDYAASS